MTVFIKSELRNLAHHMPRLVQEIKKYVYIFIAG